MKKSRTLEELQELVNNGNVHAFYVSRQWKDKRLSIFERDHYECQRCKGNFITPNNPIKRVRITKAKYVHHIVPLKDNFQLALVDDNLVSLCFRCHEIVEGRDDISKYSYKKQIVSEEKW